MVQKDNISVRPSFCVFIPQLGDNYILAAKILDGTTPCLEGERIF